MADQVEVNLDASTSSSVSHNSSFSFDADVSGTSSLDTCETDASIQQALICLTLKLRVHVYNVTVSVFQDYF